MPELSVIILTFNSIDFIKPCLDSVVRQGYADTQVIVVDNGSSDGTVNSVKDEYPAVTLLKNEKNLGAARARNMGIAAAAGKWIFTQDCDVVLEKGFFSQAMGLLKAAPEDLGIVQPKILCSDKKTVYSCGIYLSHVLKRFYDVGKGRPDRGEFSEKRPVFGACSAAAFYRRSMLDKIKDANGYFDERFFFLVEDVDLSWRASQAGYKAVFLPDAVCYHRGDSSSTGGKLRQYLCWRNRRYLLAKLKLNKAALAAIFLIYDLPRFIFLVLTNPYVRGRKGK